MNLRDYLSSNIKLINAHDALLILKASSSTSHVLFMLRCLPCLGYAILSQIDEVLKSKIIHIANVVLCDAKWVQASLPVKAGGLRIRRAASLTLPAYLTSAISTTSLQDLILIRSVATAEKYYTLYHSNWSSAYNQSFPLDATACKQRAWDEPIVKDDINHFFATASQRDESRLLAVTSPHSGDWLHVLPIASCGLRLENEDIRVAVGLRLGAAL